MKLVVRTCGARNRNVVETKMKYKRTGSVTSPSTKRSKPDLSQKLYNLQMGDIRSPSRDGQVCIPLPFIALGGTIVYI